jgi:hypothetical protein
VSYPRNVHRFSGENRRSVILLFAAVCRYSRLSIADIDDHLLDVDVGLRRRIDAVVVQNRQRVDDGEGFLLTSSVRGVRE